MPILHVLLVLLAMVLAFVSAYLAGPGATWQRTLALAVAFLAASMIPW